MFDSIFAAGDTTIALGNLVLSLGVSLVLGLMVAFSYMKTHTGGISSESFAITLVMLPAVVTVIILLVGSNVARAFSLAGAFAIIRFRSAPGEPKDIMFVLMTMAVGLACGMGYVAYAAVVAVLLCMAVAALSAVQFGKPKGSPKRLKIMVPEDLDFENAFDSVLQKYTNDYKLLKVRTTDLGSLYELTYNVQTKKDLSEKAFLDELRCRNGNLNIILTMDAPQTDTF